MVKIGFICEGKTEAILLSSESFIKLLESLNLELVNVIDATGCGNLLPHNISGYITRLEEAGAEQIFILTDLDTDACITSTRQRINSRLNDTIIVAVKQIECWFLSCVNSMKGMLKTNDYGIEYPEDVSIPFLAINDLLICNLGRGIGNHSAGKIKLANRMLENGWDLRCAAAHPECHSARYFLTQLTKVGAF